MRSKALDDINVKRHIIQCDCRNSSHLLITEYDPEFHDITFYMTDDWRAPFLQRVKNAFNYIFFKRHYEVSNTVGVGMTDYAIEDLKEWIKDIEEYKKQNR